MAGGAAAGAGSAEGAKVSTPTTAMAAVRTADRKSFKVATTNRFTAVYGVKLTDKHSIPRHREMSKKPLARAGMRDSSGSYDSRRLSDLRGTAGPDRPGSRRDGRASSGPAGERAGAAGPRDELRGCWSGAADRRRHDPDVAPAFRGRRGRWPDRIQLRGSRLPVDPGAAGDAEGLGRRHLADPDGRSVDRTRVRGCLREPFRADCAVASSGTGTSQARGGVAQARS